MEYLLHRAVRTIHERFPEPLSLDDLARSAMVSKFYFLRLFTGVTNVTPGRFLSAVRLQQARRLLLYTPLNVADVAMEVGYSSTGTFSRRFSESVGLSPTRYRLRAQGECQEPPATAGAPAPHHPSATISGSLRVEGEFLGPLYLGAFNSPILQGPPVARTTLSGPGEFTLDRVPPGTWYLHAVTLGSHRAEPPYADLPLIVATVGPITVPPDSEPRIEVVMRPADWTRPPVLLALPGLDPLSAPPTDLARVPFGPRPLAWESLNRPVSHRAPRGAASADSSRLRPGTTPPLTRR